jgi:hypothetical protein
MAPPRRRSKAAAANPSTVLIVFLVFFILLSIGLGVWGYFGYKDAKAKADAGKKEQDAAKAAKTGQEYYQLQALWAKAAAGHELSSNDLTQLTDLYGRLGSFNESSKPVFEAAMKEDKKNLKWNENTKRFDTTYLKEWDTLTKKIKDLDNKLKAKETELTTVKDGEEKRDKANSEAWNTLRGEIKTINDRAKTRTEEADTEVRKAQDTKNQELKVYTDKILQLQKDYMELQKSNAKVLKEKDSEIAKLLVEKARLESKSDEKAAQADVLALDSPRGKIVRVDSTGKMPYINLGRADGVKAQLTFSIFGVDSYGKVEKQPKASIEVVKVVAAHLSQARVTYVRDLGADPIQEGDQVYNPAWNPNRKTHVAIAGIVDFTGEESGTVSQQMRALREFMSALERQNMVVDAYLDLQTLKMKGSITLKTDYFVLAEGPTYGTAKVLDLKDERVDFKSRTNAAMSKMREEANKKGVTIIPLHKFALLMGYRIPKATRSGTETDYRPTLGSDKDKGEKDMGDKGKGDKDKGDKDKGDKDKGEKRLGENGKMDDKKNGKGEDDK